MVRPLSAAIAGARECSNGAFNLGGAACLDGCTSTLTDPAADWIAHNMPTCAIELGLRVTGDAGRYLVEQLQPSRADALSE